MRLTRLLIRRALFAIPQIFLITGLTFLLLRLIPGNPAYAIAGQFASDERIHSIEIRLGLDKPISTQYWLYLARVSKGDLGESWFTTRRVTQEILTRGPATLELITYSLLVAVALGFILGAWVALGRGRVSDPFLRFYGYLAGALPLFWIALMLSFIFFFTFGWLPSPFGRLDQGIAPPARVTGFYTIDSLLAGDLDVFWSAVAHLTLPVLSLVLFYASLILKLTSATIEENLRSEYCDYARACGLPDLTVLRYAIRNSVAPLLTLSGLIYGAMLGGAVLVENVYSWNGLGSYAVASVTRSDYFPVQGFILVAAVFNLVVYFAVDVVQYVLDPRVEA